MNDRDSGLDVRGWGLGTRDWPRRPVQCRVYGRRRVAFGGLRTRKIGAGAHGTASPGSRVPSPGKQSGFTLIEVMAAFAIFAVLFGVILQILSTSVSNTRRSGDFTEAALLAQSRLDMVGVETLPEPGRYSGEFNDDYRWEMLIEPYIIDDGGGVAYEELPIDLFYVGLTVYWDEGERERSARFETLRSVDRFYAERQEARR